MVEYTESYRSEMAQCSQRVCQPVNKRAHQRQGASTLRTVLVSITGLMLGLSLVAPVQAQRLGPVLSGIGGLTPPERATGQAVETLCPELSPNQTSGGVGDLQIRCTELVGNALGGNTSAVRNPLLAMAPEEIVAQGTNAVETSSRARWWRAWHLSRRSVALCRAVHPALPAGWAFLPLAPTRTATKTPPAGRPAFMPIRGTARLAPTIESPTMLSWA